MNPQNNTNQPLSFGSLFFQGLSRCHIKLYFSLHSSKSVMSYNFSLSARSGLFIAEVFATLVLPKNIPSNKAANSFDFMCLHEWIACQRLNQPDSTENHFKLPPPRGSLSIMATSFFSKMEIGHTNISQWCGSMLISLKTLWCRQKVHVL